MGQERTARSEPTADMAPRASVDRTDPSRNACASMRDTTHAGIDRLADHSGTEEWQTYQASSIQRTQSAPFPLSPKVGPAGRGKYLSSQPESRMRNVAGQPGAQR